MPARKALPTPPKDTGGNDPPPPLPARPGGLRQPPLPPPSHDSAPNEVYSEAVDPQDEYEEPGQQQPFRPPPIAPTEVYDELTMVVSQDKSPVNEIPSEQYEEFEVESQAVYEMDTPEALAEYEEMLEQPKPPRPSGLRDAPTPPDTKSLPPAKGKKSVKDSSPAVPNRPTPAKKLVNTAPAAGLPGLNQNDLLSKLQSLRPVDGGSDDTANKQPAKFYEMDDSVKSTMNKFKQKEAKAKADEEQEQNRRSSYRSSKPDLPQRPGQVEQPPLPPPPNTIPKTPLSPNSTSRNSFPDLPPPPPIEEEIYDDALSKEKHELDPYRWFHGVLGRDDGRSRIKNIGKDGTFLVRQSEKGGERQPYTMMVLYDGHIYNLKIRLTKKGYALGEEKIDEITFKDVPELVCYHQKNDVILVKNEVQSRTLLTEIPERLQ